MHRHYWFEIEDTYLTNQRPGALAGEPTEAYLLCWRCVRRPNGRVERSFTLVTVWARDGEHLRRHVEEFVHLPGFLVVATPPDAEEYRRRGCDPRIVGAIQHRNDPGSETPLAGDSR